MIRRNKLALSYTVGSIAALGGAVAVIGACTTSTTPGAALGEDGGAYSLTNCPSGGVLANACATCIETSCATELSAVNSACSTTFACVCPAGADASACTSPSGCSSAITSAIAQCTSCNTACSVTPSGDGGVDSGPDFTDAGPTDSGSSDSAADAGGPAGNLWVTDDFGGTSPSVLGFTVASLTAGNVAPVTTFSGAATTFTGPTCVAFDASGNLWVVDSLGSKQTGQLDMFPAASVAAGGNVAPTVTIAGANTLLGNPAGCAFDSAGALWVTNIDPINAAATVVAFSATQLAAGGNVAPAVQVGGGCNNIDLAFDAAGNLWVANLCSPIAEYAHADLAAGGNISPIATITQSTGVSGITFDSAGNLWTTLQGGVQGASEFAASQVADAGANLVASVTISGATTKMSSPFGVAAVDGNLWVVQQQTNLLTMFGSALLTTGGNVAPTVTVSGAGTKLSSPTKIVFH